MMNMLITISMHNLFAGTNNIVERLKKTIGGRFRIYLCLCWLRKCSAELGSLMNCIQMVLLSAMCVHTTSHCEP